jgi:hypothetical protein
MHQLGVTKSTDAFWRIGNVLQCLISMFSQAFPGFVELHKKFDSSALGQLNSTAATMDQLIQRLRTGRTGGRLPYGQELINPKIHWLREAFGLTTPLITGELSIPNSWG